MTNASRPARLLASVVGLACLAFALFLFVDTTRARPTGGVWRTTSYDDGCARDASWRAGPATLVSEPFHGELLERRAAPARARCDVYRGYLVVREASRLSLELHASGSTRVVFGKQELLALDAGGVRITRRVERPLPSGAHLIEIRSDQSGQLAYLRLSALIEPLDAATTLPLAARALLPLEHDALAPSPVDAERVRNDASFARRTAPRLAMFLFAILGALLAPLMPRSFEAVRAGWRSIDTRLAILVSLAVVTLIGWVAWSPSRVAIDPHFIAHGARAWRTLWFSLPARSIADSIPALGVTEWTLGAAHALGGDEGPAVLAIASTALCVALVVGTARLVDGGRAAAVTLVSLVALHVLTAPHGFDRAHITSLTLASIVFTVTASLARSRLGAIAARLSRRRTRDLDPSSTVRLTHPRLTRACLVLIVLVGLSALSLGAHPASLAPLVVLALVMVFVSARDAWTARV